MEKTLLRRLNTSILITVVCLAVAVLVLMFYKPVPKDSAVEKVNSALEERRAAETKLMNAKLDSIRIENKLQNEAYKQRDSGLILRLEENTQELKRNRNEKPRDYSSYGSAELQRAVADLVRQHSAQK